MGGADLIHDLFESLQCRLNHSFVSTIGSLLHLLRLPLEDIGICGRAVIEIDAAPIKLIQQTREMSSPDTHGDCSAHRLING